MHFLFLIFVAADQITKAVFADRDFRFLGLHLHPMKNYGLPFGYDFGVKANLLLLLFVYLVAGWMALRMQNVNRAAEVGRVMFLAGASSNLADRLIYGYVRDFIDISLGFVFNLADVLIVAGLVLMLFAGRKRQSASNPEPTGQTYQN